MRTYTILFSIAAHVIAVIAFVTSTVLATGTLPEPRRATEFIIVRPDVPTVPPPPPRRAVVRPPVSADTAPIEAPVGVHQEPPRDPALESPPGVNGSLVSGDAFGVPVRDAVPPPPAPPSPTGPVRVGGLIRQPQRTHYVAPVYPPIALSAHISGIVILETVIGENGTVDDVRVLRSVPLLDQAAIDAVRKWTFTPTLLNGQPVPIVMTVTVAFNAQ